MTYWGATAARRNKRDGNGGGKDANRVSQRASDHEHDRCKTARPEAEAALQQRVRGDQISPEIARQQGEGDHNAAEDVPGRDLEEREVADVSDARNADECDGAGLGRHHRDQHCPPRDHVVGDEVVAGGAVAASEPHAERGRTAEVQNDDDQIERREDGPGHVRRSG